MNGWIGSLSGFFDGYSYFPGPVSIRIDENKITEIKFDTVSSPEIDGRGKIFSPPFTDGHTHLIFGGTRFNELSLKLSGHSYSDILTQGGGIQSTVSATREASDDQLAQLVKQRLDVMLSHGTQTVEIKSGYGLSTEHELRILRILREVDANHYVNVIPTFGAAHVYPKDQSQDEYLSQIIDEMLPIVAGKSLATSTDVFCDRGAFSIEDTLAIFDASVKYHLPVKVHAEELEYRGIAKIASSKYNLLSADHLLFAKKDDFDTLAENQSVAMFMPSAPLGLFTKQYPRGFDHENLIIGLGSDFNPNNWSISMQTAMRLGVYNYRLTPLQAITAAVSGSYLGITGKPFPRIKTGSTADFNLLQASSPSELISKFGQNLVSHIFKNGSLVNQNVSSIA